MLSKSQRERADELLKTIREEISGRDTYSLTLGDIQWLAERLVELDNELTAVYSTVTETLANVVFPNPVTVDGKLVAILKDKMYECFFCSFPTKTAEEAFVHGKKHI